MNKEIAKIVIYYTDGTYQEVETVKKYIPRQDGLQPRGPFVAQPATQPLPGQWSYPPADTGIKIVD
jgi:hypothetical protein